MNASDLEPNSDGLPVMYVDHVVKDRTFTKSQIENFVPRGTKLRFPKDDHNSELKRHKADGKSKGVIEGKEKIDFYEIKRIAKKIMPSNIGVSEEWLGPLSDRTMSLIGVEKGQTIQE